MVVANLRNQNAKENCCLTVVSSCDYTFSLVGIKLLNNGFDFNWSWLGERDFLNATNDQSIGPQRINILTQATWFVGPNWLLQILGRTHTLNSLPSARTTITIVMDGVGLRDDVFKDRVRTVSEFLDPTDQRARSYRADIMLMLQQKRRRLVLNIDDIREHSRELADGWVTLKFVQKKACLIEQDCLINHSISLQLLIEHWKILLSPSRIDRRKSRRRIP